MAAVSVCSIGEAMNRELQAFRFNRSTKPRALILKIDPVSKELVADGELLEDVTLDELKEEVNFALTAEGGDWGQSKGWVR